MAVIDRAKNLLLQPTREWAAIDAERTTPEQLFAGYVLILAAIGPMASLIGMSVFGIELPFVGRIRTPLLSGLGTAVITYALNLILVFVLSRVIDRLAPTFGGRRDSRQALKLAAYGCTAAWIGGVFSLIPALSALGILAACYSLYLLYVGLPVLMKNTPTRTRGYLVAVVLVNLVIMIPIVGVLTFLNSAMYGSSSISADPAATEAMNQLESFAKGLEEAGKKAK
ncbi:MAG: Yip1 family protein [Nitrospiraceae bacterium]